VCLDCDAAGQAAARRWTAALQAAHVPASRVTLPEGQDPNSLFVAGASASDFLGLLRGAMS
jgi:DNA primase